MDTFDGDEIIRRVIRCTANVGGEEERERYRSFRLGGTATR